MNNNVIKLEPNDPLLKEDHYYCKSHESAWTDSESCPWCQRDKLLDELEFIKEIFQAAVANHRKKPGGQQVQYHGDFASIPPSTAGQMEWYVRRWDEFLKQ
jgi:hypothetical protein